jgi:CPA2 family monovalent cation:H+ antiporter-2
MQAAPDTLLDLAIVLCTAAVTTIVFQRLRQPVVLGYVLAGFLIGPYSSFPLYADRATVQTLADIGVVVLLFSIGLEFSVRKLLRMGARSGMVTALACGVTLWLGFSVARLMGWSPAASAFAAGMISVSSTMFVAASLAERNVERDERDLIFGVTVFEDMVGILLIAALSTLAGGLAVDSRELSLRALQLAMFLAVALVVGLLTIPRLVRAFVRLESRQTMLVASIGISFALALLARSAGYSIALGAFLAGVLVAESGEAQRIEILVRPVRDVFAAIFFVAVGMLLDPGVLVEVWPIAVALTGVLLVGKIGCVVVGGWMSGLSTRSAVKAGAILSQTGEFSFLIAAGGASLGSESRLLHPLAVALCVLSLASARFLASRSEPLGSALDRRLPKAVQTYLSLWGDWLEDLRHRRETEPRPRARLSSVAAWLAVDAAAISALVIGVSLSFRDLSRWLEEISGLSPAILRWVVLLATVVASLPFVIGILHLSRRAARLLAVDVIPAPAALSHDAAAAPRRAFEVGLQIAVLLCLGLPVLALVQPFLPSRGVAAAAILAAAALGFVFWRRAADLQGHVRAGAQVVVEILGRQARAAQPHELESASGILPGLGTLTPVKVELASDAVGQTLAELDVHGRCGASVVAIQRGEHGVIAPSDDERVRAGDVLALTGSESAIRSACGLLGARKGEEGERVR